MFKCYIKFVSIHRSGNSSSEKMKRFTLFLLVPLAFGGAAFAQNSSRDSLDQVTAATVYVKVGAEAGLLGLTSSGSGTGFFISEDGYIATNYHVIQPLIPVYSIAYPVVTNTVTVIVNSGRKNYQEFPATICAIDKLNDLAILHIDDTASTPSLKLHTSDDLVETSGVRVFGFPFGEEFAVIQRGPEVTVTTGTITALRHNDKDELATIQVNAIVNPGNSGGPCINSDGDVIGIIHMSGGETMQNFGVPSHFLEKLMSTIRASGELPSSCSVQFRCTPEGSSLFVDGFDSKSSSEFPLTVTSELHTFCLMKAGYEPWVAEIPVSGDTSVDVVLKRQAPIALNAIVEIPKTEEEVLCEKKSGSRELMTEHFNTDKVFLDWEQSTGGLGERTWFLEKSTLRQFEADGLLHSISLGDTSWTDYIVQTKMKIDGSEGDPRAGIIFRENWRGFYLFRIHRETNKAQLAYHSKHPFGWVILKERELGDVDDQWHDISVSVHGKEVSCFMDDACIFKTIASFSDAGRIGFYSVESQPTFDSLSVSALTSVTAGKITAEEPEVISYWFTDRFSMSEEAWYTYKNDETEPHPWIYSDRGRLISAGTNETFNAEFTRYSLGDFTMNLIVTLGFGENAVFELIFGKTTTQEYALRFVKSISEIQLVQRSNGIEKLLKKTSMSPEFFGYVNRLNVQIDQGKLNFSSSQGDLLEYSGKKLVNYAGRFAVSMQDGQIVLHEFNGTSIGEE